MFHPSMVPSVTSYFSFSVSLSISVSFLFFSSLSFTLLPSGFLLFFFCLVPSLSLKSFHFNHGSFTLRSNYETHVINGKSVAIPLGVLRRNDRIEANGLADPEIFPTLCLFFPFAKLFLLFELHKLLVAVGMQAVASN